MRNNKVKAAKEELWALDFDGVICDSCGESSLSAWKAAQKIWPDIMTSDPVLAQKEALLDKMRVVRPVIETGYENIVQLRCLIEGTSTDVILDNWSETLTDSMKRWGLNRSELVELFGATRDKWMAADLSGWLAPNRIFAGLAEALCSLLHRCEVYIVTTKQERFTHVLLRDMAKVEFPLDRIISTTVSGQPKTEILHELQAKYPNVDKFHFIEDKLSTLEKVCADEGLSSWRLYLANWGYNTPSEQTRAAAMSRIDVIDLQNFISLLENGLILSKE